MTLAASPRIDEGIEAIREAIAPDSERDPAHYVIDGVIPAAAFEPATRRDTAAILALASEHGLTVAPQGGRTALSLGQPLEGYDLALDLGALRATVEYEPADLTVTVEAGRLLGTLQVELAAHGQYLPIDPPPGDDVTIGGLLATARPGAWRNHVPAARDLILGMEVALPSGERVRSGGRVVKNVTGYDLHRLHTGALGAFGVILEATFKLAPLPEATRTFVASTPNVEAATAMALRTWDASPALRALSVLTPAAARLAGLPEQPSVLLELAGTASTVERSIADLRAVLPLEEARASAWLALRGAHGDASRTVIRAGLPPTKAPVMIEAMTAAGAAAWTHVAAGAVIGTFERPPEPASLVALREEAERADGFLVVESAPPDVRHAVATFPGDATLVGALRDRFDPGRSINRGRWGAEL